MQHDTRHHLVCGLQHATIVIAANHWSVYVLDVVRIGGDSFLHIALLGPRTLTLTVALPRGRTTTPGAVIQAIRDWLVSDDVSDEGLIELPSSEDSAMGCPSA